MASLEISAGQGDLSALDYHIIVLLGPIYFEGRESEIVEFAAPADLLKDPSIDDVEYIGLTRQRRQFLNLLTSIPEGKGIMRRSLAKAIYPNLSLDLALEDLNSARKDLNVFLRPYHEIYNPVPRELGQFAEARYCLRRADQKISADEPQVVDWEAISEGVSQKNPDAFASLYELTRNNLFRYFYYKTNNLEFVDELISQVYTKAWEKAESFRWKQVPVTNWLLTIARNTVISHWRNQQILKKRISSIEDLDNLPDISLSPSDQAEVKFNKEVLSVALAKLPDEQQLVLKLRFIDGYSHAEVAVMLSKSVVAVRQIQSRGLNRMRTLLEAFDYQP